MHDREQSGPKPKPRLSPTPSDTIFMAFKTWKTQVVSHMVTLRKLKEE
jgi:hypothetical protein